MKKIIIFFFLTSFALCLETLQGAPNNNLQEQSASNQKEPIESKKQQTLSIIKPDAVAGNHIGEIISRFEKAGLHLVGIKTVWMTKSQAESFYAVHKERPFFAALTEFMSSGPAIVMVLEGENAIAKNRQIMGATDYRKAAPGTIRADFAQSIRKNCVHGSDSVNNAKSEISFFFTKDEIFSR